MIRFISSSCMRAAAVALLLPIAGLTAFAGGGASATGSATEIVANRVSSMRPMHLAGISLDNFGVVDGRIFRGEQPGTDDFRALAAIGVTTIVDLREDNKSSSRERAEAAGLKYVNIGIDGHGAPSDGDVTRFLEVLDDPANPVVYVHCAGGRHRTGSMIAVYRMVRDGWTIDQAYDEMLAYDFYTSNGHKGFKTFVEDYYQRMTSNPSSVPAAYRAPDVAAVVSVSH
jgi:protein tyrosine/serine phosphatase